MYHVHEEGKVKHAINLTRKHQRKHVRLGVDQSRQPSKISIKPQDMLAWMLQSQLSIFS